jgi:hypothetical protein
MIASQEYAVVCSVLVEAWAPSSGKNPLSYFEWCLIALGCHQVISAIWSCGSGL